MKEDDWNGLVGQSSADMVVLNALIAAVIARDPDLKKDLAAMVEVAALSSRAALDETQIPYFDDQLQAWRRAIQAA